jgi:hypothetical protein
MLHALFATSAVSCACINCLRPRHSDIHTQLSLFFKVSLSLCAVTDRWTVCFDTHRKKRGVAHRTRFPQNTSPSAVFLPTGFEHFGRVSLGGVSMGRRVPLRKAITISPCYILFLPFCGCSHSNFALSSCTKSIVHFFPIQVSPLTPAARHSRSIYLYYQTKLKTIRSKGQ